MPEAKIHTIQYLINKYLKGVLDVDAERLLVDINDITYCTSHKEIETITGNIPIKGQR
jgi:hypothetical protein